jgi:hypothetical protein
MLKKFTSFAVPIAILVTVAWGAATAIIPTADHPSPVGEKAASFRSPGVNLHCPVPGGPLFGGLSGGKRTFAV